MRIVSLEEHYAIPDITRRIPSEAVAARGLVGPYQDTGGGQFPKGLTEVGPNRVADMDKGGVTVQVLGTAGPGADLLSPEEGPKLAREYNDRLKRMVDEYPDRFAGFAHLPMTAPEAAADELQRAVEDLGFHGAMINGLTDDRFLDDPRFDPILARAAQIDVPLYLHPNIPPASVRKAYYENLPGASSIALICYGWHMETAIHILRLVISGAMDRHRNLKMIIGHMGEGLPAMLDRIDDVSNIVAPHLARGVRETILDQVWITTSGFWTMPSFQAAIAAFGPDRILFSVDYPFGPIEPQVRFLEAMPVSPADRAKIAHGNADRLLKLNLPNA
jgi:hypothetical protein